MKPILAKAPVLAALFLVACASSQKNLSAPQQAAAQAQEQAQKAGDAAEKASAEANKSQQELNEALQANSEARTKETIAHQQAQQASAAASQAERQAGMASGAAEKQAVAAARPAPAPAPAPGPQPGAGKTGVTEAQGGGAAQQGTKIVVFTSGLLFATNSAELSPAAKPKLDDVASALKGQPAGDKIMINGYTDDTGPQADNKRLSEERAQAVANYLEGKGVSKDRVTVKGLGSDNPISSDKTVEGRAVNRRVDILVAESGQGQGSQGAAEKQGGTESSEKKGGSQGAGSQPSKPMQQPQQKPQPSQPTQQPSQPWQ